MVFCNWCNWGQIPILLADVTFAHGVVAVPVRGGVTRLVPIVVNA